MDDPSITKRLIDFVTDDHEYDEVPDLSAESSNQSQNQQQQQQLLNNSNNNRTSAELPPDVPLPKLPKKSVKNSKNNKIKSKIPRSPSFSSLGLGGSSKKNKNKSNNNNSTSSSTPPCEIPPATPPLPLNYKQTTTAGNHMNGVAAASSATASNNNNNSNVNIVNNNSSNSSVVDSGLMGGGVQQTIDIAAAAAAGANNNNNNNNSSSNSNQQQHLHHRSSVNMPSSRRPQIQISPISESSPKHFQYLTLTVHKDVNGYGMKVSGDNPVFVESVKAGGAAQIAGLVAGDMILKVNGHEVRSEKHPRVVSLIKASTIVELAVKRSLKMTRPSSVNVVPSTPILSGRDRTASITGPTPVNSIKRREMEIHKKQTLQKMLEQEMKNLERLRDDHDNPSYKQSEANILKLREQLDQVGKFLAQSSPHHVGGHVKQHRRAVSSPDNMHPRHPDRLNKTTSGSWELVENDNEITPPGTPPPPYLRDSSSMMSSGGALDDSHDNTGIFVESHHFTPLAGGISPTPHISAAHSSRIQAAQSSATQKEIISMEDEDASDQEGPFIDENGPFNHFQRLMEAENVAFLAVFLNYVLSNSEPAPLLFYLITELYKEGTAKDMRKWAYEIHSTFLVPRAPLAWCRQGESLACEVDNVLQNEFDKVEILRKVFWKSRKRAKDIICEQLREFQQKRTAGLGTIYGPTDSQLSEAKGDKQKEQQIFEETLMVKLQNFIEEYEKDLSIEDPKKLALCSALSTVIHRIFITRSHPNSIVDKVNHFVSREKSFKTRIMGKNRKVMIRGHTLVLRQYYEVTHCNHCQTIIWGVSPQGYNCTDCKLNIHRPCSKVLDENCPGPLPQAKKGKEKEPHNDSNKIRQLMGKIRPRTSNDFIAMEKRARHDEDFDSSDLINERLHSTSITRQPSDRRPDAGNNIPLRSNGNTSHNNSDLQNSFHATSSAATAGGATTPAADSSGLAESLLSASMATTVGSASVGAAGGLSSSTGGINEANAQDAEGKDGRRERLHHQHPENNAISVIRSESYKERLFNKRDRNKSRRKTSDPSLTSRPNDDQGDVGLSNSNFTASSNSSLSSGGGSESPSTSMEQVGGTAAAAAGSAPTTSHHHSHHQHHHSISHPHHTHQHSHQDSFGSSSTNQSFWAPNGQLPRFESDDEEDLNEVDWSSNVSAEVLMALTDAEKKRQEIINEIYQTERSHCRTLKLLERLFFVPLQDSALLSYDHLMLLFPPALRSLRELHGTFELQIKQRRIEHNYVVNYIGDLLAAMFDDQSGEGLTELAAQFCARQQIALEALKEKRRKDEHLQKLLTKAESHKACRRLQLKDLLPTVLQRLTKYPLLFENLYKVTLRVVPENTSEAEAIKRAVECSKKILVDVNQAVKTAEDEHKLQNIQRKLDKSSLDKEEFRNLDLTQLRLIHDGSLTMKKNTSLQLHSLLFENMIVILTKQDDKYSLKNLVVHNQPVSPIMYIDADTLVRQDAADKNTFYLVIRAKSTIMLDLRAPSSSECRAWFKHISDAAEQYKPRSKNANTTQESVDDPAISTLPHSNTKESLELTPERPTPATATVITTPLAPMMPPPMVSNTPTTYNNNHNYSNSDVQMRNGRRESTPTSSVSGLDHHKQRLSHNELSPNGVNRTMSTRSCGEAFNNYAAQENGAGVTLRHTQSARQANGGEADGAGGSQAAGNNGTNRYSTSIVYSNNSNDTRTLMQSSPPLVEPTAIQISISTAVTAQPVLTPNEKLRRLDATIREGLLEKQKIICDMFRLPVEHFHEIVDIAAMPEAPKDSADIALAAYAQVQSLTEVVNEYMQITPDQEISAVSTSNCDHCREKQRHSRPLTPLGSGSSNSISSSSTATQIAASDIPPPLPPPNKQKAQAQQQTPSPAVAKMQMHAAAVEEELSHIHEDDDGYCEIDELRLPALPKANAAGIAKANKAASPPPPLPPPAGSFKTPPAPPPPPSAATATATTTTTAAAAAPELVKRQSTISADSIPEESADEVSKANMDHHELEEKQDKEKAEKEEENRKTDESCDEKPPQKTAEEKEDESAEVETKSNETPSNEQLKEKAAETETREDKSKNEQNLEKEQNEQNSAVEQSTDTVESSKLPALHVAQEVTEEITTEDAVTTLTKLSNTLNTMVDGSTQTSPLPLAALLSSSTASSLLPPPLSIPLHASSSSSSSMCGPNRIQHASSLEPSIPCHALNNIVCALNAQISLLLPKINERDMERERLRKENQHLRELLNAMHDRKRVEDKMETPTDIATILGNMIDDKDIDDVDDYEEIEDVDDFAVSKTPTPNSSATAAEATPTKSSSKVEAHN